MGGKAGLRAVHKQEVELGRVTVGHYRQVEGFWRGAKVVVEYLADATIVVVVRDDLVTDQREPGELGVRGGRGLAGVGRHRQQQVPHAVERHVVALGRGEL